MTFSTAATLDLAIASFGILALWIVINGLVQSAIQAWKDAEHATLPQAVAAATPSQSCDASPEPVQVIAEDDLSWLASGFACPVSFAPKPVLALPAPRMTEKAIAKMRKSQLTAELVLWGLEPARTVPQMRSQLKAIALPS